MPIINLISAITSLVMGVVATIKSVKAGKAESEDERKRLANKRFSLIPGVGSVAAFLLTEEFLTKIKLVDKWTPLMLVILAGSIGVSIWTRKKNKEGQA